MQDFAARLLQWFDRHGRKDLPWHREPTPYHIWLSEIMLQQTQVATVIPYYEAFTQRFPDVAALAAAEVDDVLQYWSGLGYYARARNLHKAAQQVVAKHGGQFPSNQESLEALPGIGRSTAAAIRAQAFHQAATILDGNVKRVLARYHAVEGWPGRTAVLKRLWEHAESHTPDQRVKDYTQAIMDLGAMVCTRRKPDCGECPVAEGCEAYDQGNPEAYPTPKPRKKTPEKACWLLLLEDDQQRLLMERRPPTGIWGGLWSLPQAEPDLDIEDLPGWCRDQLGLDSEFPQRLSTFRHTFSHYHLDIMPVRLTARDSHRVQDNPNLVWYSPEDALTLGLPAPIRKVIAEPAQLSLTD
ncbi:A/G-specific adenine glycosylase [Marinobacteraceae bacterium S3BR75-40.1]